MDTLRIATLALLIPLACNTGTTRTKAEQSRGKPVDDTGDMAHATLTRVPAEWEPQHTIWMQWPQPHERWIREDFARIIAELSTRSRVQILVNDEGAEADARSFLEDHLPGFESVFFAHIQSNWSWMRDNGPVWVERDGWLTVQDWGFDGWGEPNTPHAKDDAVPCQVAELIEAPCERFDVLTERGTMEFNGTGTMIVSWTTLEARNPDMSKAALETVLSEAFGVHTVVWIEGTAADDLTDGHVDGIARFIGTDTVAVGQYLDPTHPDADMYDQAAQDIEAAGLQVERMDIPGSFSYLGVEMSAVYLNWLVTDDAVVMSSFSQPEWDAAAQAQVQTFFPGREVIAVDTRELWLEGGGVHCVTNDMPMLPLESEAGLAR